MSAYFSHPLEDGRLRQAQLKMLDMLKFIDKVCQKHGLDYWLEGGTLLGAIRHQGFIPWDDDLDISMPRESYEVFLKVAPTELPDHLYLQRAESEKGYFNMNVPLKIRENHSRYLGRNERGVEPYHQGIYVDIFPYDKQPEAAWQRRLYKQISKKILRLLFHKHAPLYLYSGHHGQLYRFLSQAFPKKFLEKILKSFIEKAKHRQSSYLGYGYDCLATSAFKEEDFYPLKTARFEDGEFKIPNNSDKILRSQFGDYTKLPPKHKWGMKHCIELIPHLEDLE